MSKNDKEERNNIGKALPGENEVIIEMNQPVSQPGQPAYTPVWQNANQIDNQPVQQPFIHSNANANANELLNNQPINNINYIPNQNQQVLYSNQQTSPIIQEIPHIQQQPNVVIINEHKTVIHKHSYPNISMGAAILVLIMNIVFPGVGTMIMGCLCNDGNNACHWIWIGFAQLLLAFFIFGWIWAIFTGAMAVGYANSNYNN
jgi:hypothetical protein